MLWFPPSLWSVWCHFTLHDASTQNRADQTDPNLSALTRWLLWMKLFMLQTLSYISASSYLLFICFSWRLFLNFSGFRLHRGTEVFYQDSVRQECARWFRPQEPVLQLSVPGLLVCQVCPSPLNFTAGVESNRVLLSNRFEVFVLWCLHFTLLQRDSSTWWNSWLVYNGIQCVGND